MKLILQTGLGLTARFTVVTPIGSEAPEEGDRVSLELPDGQLLGHAIARDYWDGDLALIPASILEMEQNPLHRTYSGLIVGLRGAFKWNCEPTSKVRALVLDMVEEVESKVLLP